MRFFLIHFPDFGLAVLGSLAQVFVLRALGAPRWLKLLVLCAGCGLLWGGFLMRSQSLSNSLPLQISSFLSMGGFMTLLLSVAFGGATLVWRLFPKPAAHHSPERRTFLLATRAAVLASPVVATGYGVFIQRDAFRLREIDVPIRGLHPDLNGMRLVQLSDIHLSPFLSEKELARAIDMANETKAHLGIMTGDLITTYRDPLDACIRQVARLRTEGGVVGCLGNHEIYARAEAYATRKAEQYGMHILRSRSEVLNFRGQPLNFAGVDYQKMDEAYLVGAENLVRPGMPNILLSHNPDVFPVAARKGFDLTISGHTHGGQITVEILNQNVSVARFYTPYVYGLYHEGDASVYVTRGIGTVGVPARLGAPPEVALLRLCAI
jgi:predicted MPP superfamily phosphohydrolase